MNVLSLFDGISCARVALGDRVKTYSACEIDKYAIQVAKKNYPDTIHLGDVRGIRKEQFSEPIDLLIGGSPCQDLSIAKKDRKGLEGDRSSLFWEYLRIKRDLNPKWFILENVASMPKEAREVITREMGVEPVMIDAALVSAQSRKRLFWTNLPVEQPADRGIVLKDILQPDGEVDERFLTKKNKAFCLSATYGNASTSEKDVQHNAEKKKRTMVKVGYVGEGEQYGQGGQAHRVYSEEGKTPTLSSFGPLVRTKSIRRLTPIECERLQSLPDNYTEGISTTQRYRCLGNAFNVEVIKCILQKLA